MLSKESKGYSVSDAISSNIYSDGQQIVTIYKYYICKYFKYVYRGEVDRVREYRANVRLFTV